MLLGVVILFFLSASLLEINILIWSLPVVFTCLFKLSRSWWFDGVFLGDYYSTILSFLSLWVFYLSIISIKPSPFSSGCLYTIIFFIIFRFYFFNYLIFYVFFEVSFVLIFIFLLSIGPTIERIQASLYMFFYTMVFSLPFLVFLLYYYPILGSSFFSLSFSDCTFILFYFFMFIVLITKLPLYGVHLWLPKAHVEAPLSGSIILAGVILKLGGYGIIRFSFVIPFLFYGQSIFISFLFYLCILGSIYVCVLCVRQNDLKIIIAYSSVVHIRVIILGLLSFRIIGVWGALLIMVAHGFISPLLFLLIGLSYNLFSSRRVFILKGLILTSPVFRIWWFISNTLNLSLPPFISFFSEAMIFSSLRMVSLYDLGFIFLILIITGVYCIFLYTIPAHGERFSPIISNINVFHSFLRFSHCYFVLLYPVLFLIWLDSLIKIITCGVIENSSHFLFAFFSIFCC